jgi:hypothetical protein
MIVRYSTAVQPRTTLPVLWDLEVAVCRDGEKATHYSPAFRKIERAPTDDEFGHADFSKYAL